MVSKIKHFFDKYVKQTSDTSDEIATHSLQIATAALLIEMMRADSEINEDEKVIITKSMRSKFGLTDRETDALLKLAENKIWEATGYHEFTSLMNKRFSYGQKIKVIEYLWEVAYADNILNMHEEYMVRKIAGLIYVSHKDFIDAKLRVKRKL